MKNEVTRKDYFIYKNVMYGVGTKVLLNDSVHLRFYNTTRAKDRPYTFTCSFSDGYNLFCSESSNNPKEKWMCGQIQLRNYDEDIKTIIDPVYVELVPWQQKALDNMINKTVSPDIFGGVLLYAMAMIIGALFIDRLLIWVFATVIFICWLLNQYRT